MGAVKNTIKNGITQTKFFFTEDFLLQSETAKRHLTKWIGQIIRDIWYYNADEYFNLQTIKDTGAEWKITGTGSEQRGKKIFALHLANKHYLSNVAI